MKNIRVKAFSLLECLVALLIIAGSISLYQGLTTVLASHTRILSDNSRNQWLVFVQQFQTELEGTRLLKVENNRLYVKKDQQEMAFGHYRAGDFRKTNARGRGYQPMLFDLSSATIRQEDDLVILHVQFENGLERSFVYAFETLEAED